MDHAHICPSLQQLFGCAVAVHRGRAVTKAAGVGDQAGVKAVGNLLSQRQAHCLQQIKHQFAVGRRIGAQQEIFCVAGIGTVVVDAQLNLVRKVAQLFTEQLGVRDVHRHHCLRDNSCSVLPNSVG